MLKLEVMIDHICDNPRASCGRVLGYCRGREGTPVNAHTTSMDYTCIRSHLECICLLLPGALFLIEHLATGSINCLWLFTILDLV